MQALRSASQQMATRTRDTAPAAKEKRGTSPSQTGLTQHSRRSPSSSTANSPAKNRNSTTTPNYLKPTDRSRPEPSNTNKQGKKPAISTTDGPHKPTLIRKRSFDKPPPKAQSRVSPNPSLRSSGKTVSGPKGVSGKQYGRPVGTVKKSVYVRKQDIGTSGTSTTKEQVVIPIEKVEDFPNIVENPETQPAIQEFTTSEAEEEKVHVEENDENGDIELVVKDQEPVIIEQNEANSDKDVKIVDVEGPTVLEEDDTSIGVEIKDEPEHKPQVEEISNEKDELNYNNNVTDQIVAGNTNEEVQDKDEEEDKKEEMSSESENPETKETEVEVVEEKKEEKIAVPKPKVQVIAQGKRDSAVSNDVIEETASKLREQRKNKVRALAGAFETVISLQDK